MRPSSIEQESAVMIASTISIVGDWEITIINVATKQHRLPEKVLVLYHPPFGEGLRFDKRMPPIAAAGSAKDKHNKHVLEISNGGNMDKKDEPNKKYQAPGKDFISSGRKRDENLSRYHCLTLGLFDV